jgi:hypothetical protein
MDAQMVEAIRKLVETIGVLPSCIMAGGAAMTAVALHVWRSRKADKAAGEVIKAKDESIARLADQVRELRFRLMAKDGFTTEQAYILVYEKPWPGGTSPQLAGQQPQQLLQSPAELNKQQPKSSKKGGR